MVDDGSNLLSKKNLDWSKDAPLCNCPDKERVLYYCMDETCPMRKETLFYCQVCLEEERHDHGAITIPKKMNKVA